MYSSGIYEDEVHMMEAASWVWLISRIVWNVSTDFSWEVTLPATLLD